jgi:hypothetical protein
LPCAFLISGYRATSAGPGLGRLNVLGAEYRVGRGTIFAGQPSVRERPVPVSLYVTAVRIREHFVQYRSPVMCVGRVKAHRGCALESFQRTQVRHLRRRSRLRDVVRSRAGRPSFLKVGRTEADRKLGIPLVQVADSRVKFNRSPRPAGHVLARPVSGFHLLVVS